MRGEVGVHPDTACVHKDVLFLYIAPYAPIGETGQLQLWGPGGAYPWAQNAGIIEAFVVANCGVFVGAFGESRDTQRDGVALV